MGPVSWRLDGEVAVLTLASPPANALDEVVAPALVAALAAIEDSSASALVVCSGVPGRFAQSADVERIAGVDRTRFVSLLTSFREAVETLGALPLVSIAAVDGTALGGGLELALACTIRIGSRASRLGFPEVKAGLLSGGGGTQRLPRLIGRAAALDLLITGRLVGGEEALELRLIDRVTEAGDAVREAFGMARRLSAVPRSTLASITRCVDVAESLSFPEGMAVEAEETVQLFTLSPEGRGTSTP